MPPYDGGEILRRVCHERYEILRFAQNDTPSVVASPDLSGRSNLAVGHEIATLRSQ